MKISNQLIKLASIFSVLLLTCCQQLSQPGPVHVKNVKEGKVNGNLYKVIDINSTNLNRYNRSISLRHYSIPSGNSSKRYSSKITTNDTLQLTLIDNREAGLVNGVATLGPYEVDDRGKVSLPYVGIVNAKGRSLDEIERQIKSHLIKLSNSIEVSLVRTARLHKRVNVTGLVNKPGQYLLDKAGLTITDVIALSGGEQKEPYLCEYELYRSGSIYPLSSRQINSSKLLVQDGDHVKVTENKRYYVNVLGAVPRQGRHVYSAQYAKLADFLATSNGLNIKTANASGVFVFRNKRNGVTEVYRFNLKQPSGLIYASKFNILLGDTLYVSEAPLSRWNRAIRNVLSLSSISRVANTLP